MFRGSRSARYLIAWIAVLVQLNVFFHLELHHRVVGARLLRDAAKISTVWTEPHPSPVPRPFCPVCQIARQGAVQPAAERLALLPLQVIAAALPAYPSSIPVIFLLHPSGRDPPRV